MTSTYAQDVTVTTFYHRGVMKKKYESFQKGPCLQTVPVLWYETMLETRAFCGIVHIIKA